MASPRGQPGQDGKPPAGQRAAAGRFAPGNPGGPGGRRDNAGRKPADVRAIVAQIQALEHTGQPLAVKVVSTLTDMALGKTEAEPARVAACRALLDRLVGKPRETVDIAITTGPDILGLIQDAEAAAGAQLVSDAASTPSTNPAKPGPRR